jgi:hypothetical protein
MNENDEWEDMIMLDEWDYVIMLLRMKEEKTNLRLLRDRRNNIFQYKMLE